MATSRKSDVDPEPRLPIKLAPVSNGEFIPDDRPELRAVARAARDAIDDNARRAGLSRRELLATACGAATTLATLNSLGCGGGRYDVPRNAGVDPAAARAALGGAGEVVFDVQTHHVNPTRDWFKIN